jgi:hypothetical protein
MDRNELVDLLLAMPLRIHASERNLLAAQDMTRNAQRILDERERELLQSDVIDGKNAEVRKAQLQDMTKGERLAVTVAAQDEAIARTDLTLLQNEFAAFRAAARLLAGEVA